MMSFHFLRPEWLVLILPALFVGLFKLRQHKQLGQWQSIIAPQLRAYVMSNSERSSSQLWVTVALVLAIVMALIAMAGPTWEKQESPVYATRSGLIIGLDLSISMSAKDVSPSRVQRAKYKIVDILKSPKIKDQFSQVGLIAYAEDAHVVTPLTEDGNTIEALLPALDPYMMPAMGGSNFQRLVENAVNMFEQIKSEPRQLLVITDGVEPLDIEPASQLLSQHNVDLAIIAIGTEQGAPMVKPDGRFITDQQGRTIMPGLEWDHLTDLSQAADGRITHFSNTDQDFLSVIEASGFSEAEKTNETAQFDQWKDMGHWFVLPVMLLALVGFRRGTVIPMLIIAMSLPNETWAAPEWMPSWLLNQDQQGYRTFQQDPKAAANTFKDKNWQASSHYKSGEYEQALQAWSNTDDAQSWYNRGNALAQLNRFEEAIKAYDTALAKDPNLEDAQFNKSLVEQLMQQQESNQSSQSSQDGQQGQQNQQNQQNQQGQSGDNSGEQNPSDQMSPSDAQQQQQQQQNAEQQGSPSDEQLSQLQQGDESANPTDEQQANALDEKESSADEGDEEALANQAKDAHQKQQDQNEQQSGFIKQPITDSTQTEKSQALQQWMSRIPDDPSGLLRNKFYYQYQQRNRSQREGDRKSW